MIKRICLDQKYLKSKVFLIFLGTILIQTDCSLIYTHENQTNQLIWTKHFELVWVYSKFLFITLPALFVDCISVLTSENRSTHCPKATWKLTHLKFSHCLPATLRTWLFLLFIIVIKRIYLDEQHSETKELNKRQKQTSTTISASTVLSWTKLSRKSNLSTSNFPWRFFSLLCWIY